MIIPALNEEENLPLVLEGLPPVDEIVIVDGGSADDTVAIAREIRPDAIVVRQTRTGKGNALACGFAAASGDIVVTLNADGSTDPGELPRYVDALLSGAEVAHGSRFRDGGEDLVGHRLDRLGNATLSRLVNALFGARFTDLGYGYNAYWRSLLPLLDLTPIEGPRLKRGRVQWGDGPEIEPLINIRTAAQGMRVVEVASVGYPPINGAADRQRLARALRAMRVAFAEFVRRWRIDRRAPADGARHGVAGHTDTDIRMQRAELDDTATRLRREALYDTGTRLRLGAPDDTATRLRREHLYGTRARRRRDELTDTGTRLRADAGIPTGDRYDTGTRMRAGDGYDTGTRARGGTDHGGMDRGARSQSVRPYDEIGARRRAAESDAISGRRAAYDHADHDRADHDHAAHDHAAWHEDGAGGPWPDSAQGPRRPDTVVRHDPAAQERRDPQGRHGLPSRPAPDPSLTQTSGRHAAIGDAPIGDAPIGGAPIGGAGPDRRRPEPWRYPDEKPAWWDARRNPTDPRRGYPAEAEDELADTGARHRIEPAGWRGTGGHDAGHDSWGDGSRGHDSLGHDSGGHDNQGHDGRRHDNQGHDGRGLDSGGHDAAREVGGRRRWIDAWERPDGRPDLTVVSSEVWEPRSRASRRSGEDRDSRGGRPTGENSRGWEHGGSLSDDGEPEDRQPGGWEPGGPEPGRTQRRKPDAGRRPNHLRAVQGDR